MTGMMTKFNPAPSLMSKDDFLATFGGVYEASPWVAEAVWPEAKAGNADDPSSLQKRMREAVENAGREKQMALVRAHPELAGRAAIAGEMTEESKSEQKGAGLDRCSPEEFAEFMTLNERYNEKFGFPFIIAVKGHDRQSILAAFRQRIENDVETEFKTAVEQIHRIAAIRLSALAGEED